MTDDQPPPSREAEETARLLTGAQLYIETLPADERAVAEMAAAGVPVWEIAQRSQVSEAAVARMLDGVVAAVTGRPIHPVETGGLGSDTDPGVTGDSDDPGVGALDPESLLDTTEPPRRLASE